MIFFLVPVANAGDRTGWAMSGGVGPTYLRDKDGDETFKGNDWGFILGVEYRFIPSFALGINIFNLGTANDTFGGVDTEIQVDGIDIAARIILPVSEKAELFGLIGRASYYADVDPGFSNFGEDAWEFGAGIDIDTSEDFSIRIEGRYFDGPRDESGGLATIGFSYRF